MRAITEGLFVTEATLAPKVGLPAFDFDHVGGLLGNRRRVAHIFSLSMFCRLIGGHCMKEFVYRVTQ